MSTLLEETVTTKFFEETITDLFSDETKVNEKIQAMLNTPDSFWEKEDGMSSTGEILGLSQAQCSGSRLIDIHSPAFKPSTPESEMPPVQLPTKNSSMGLLELYSSDTGSSDLKEKSTETSLFTLLLILGGWVSRCMGKNPTHPENADLVDLKDYAEKEIVYGLGILKKLYKRVDTLLKSAEGLPDPDTILASGLEGNKSSIRDRLNDAGLKVKRQLDSLEVEGIEDFSSFISVCNDISEQNYDEFYVKELKVMIFSIVTNSIMNVSENVLMLSLEIKKFRDKIREFCTAIDKLM